MKIDKNCKMVLSNKKCIVYEKGEIKKRQSTKTSMKNFSKGLINSIVALMVFLVLAPNNLKSQWAQSSSGIGNEIVYTFARNGSSIYAGTDDAGLFRSINSGANWTAVSGVPSTFNVWVLYSSGSNIFAGTFGDGVYRSTNNGVNWTQVNAGLTNFNPRGFMVKAAFVFGAFWGGGIYRSSNNGTDWFPSSSGLTNLTNWTFAVIGNNLFVASFGGGVFLSTHDGTNWTAVNSGLTSLNVYDLEVMGFNLYAGTSSGVFLSTNSGVNWTFANQGITGNVQSLHVKGTNIVAGSTSGVFRSTNNGTTWTVFNQGLDNTNVLSIIDDNTYIYAGTNGGGVYRRLLSEIITSVKTISMEVPEKYTLSQNYPNPFNPVTNIHYQIPSNVKGQTSNVILVIYNTTGKEIATLVNQKQNAGTYEVQWDASDYSSGVYYYKLFVDEVSVDTKKMLLLK